MASDLHLDQDYYFRGLQNRRLLLQKCRSCGRLRFPPLPVCEACHDRGWDPIPASGKGRVDSFIVMRRPKPPVGMPGIVAIIELQEGVRLVSSLTELDEASVSFDMEVELTFLEMSEGRLTHAFRPAAVRSAEELGK